MIKLSIQQLTLAANLLFFLTSNVSEARTWDKIKIPGGKCGNGSDYSIYLSRKDPKKLAFYFQGGGACWNNLTCKGPIPLTLLWIPDYIPDFNFLADESERSVISDFSVVYFPYCTGDVFSGTHSADYGYFRSSMVHHWGAINVRESFNYLGTSQIVDAASADKIVVYGVSAGAIGAIFSMNIVNEFLSPHQEKVAILDSPGLHFDSSLYKLLPEAMLQDMRRSLEGIGIEFDINSANFARHAPRVCERFRDWRVGILQSSRDIVMSMLFGGIWPQTHEELVMGSEGIFQATGDHFQNCSSWVPNSLVHTFLMLDWTSSISAGGVSAREYATQVIEGSHSGTNHR
jgi:hypothetical protein